MTFQDDPHLEGLTGELKGREFNLIDGDTTIGRGKENIIQVLDRPRPVPGGGMVLRTQVNLAIRRLSVAGDPHCDKLTAIVLIGLDIAMLGYGHLGRNRVQRTADPVRDRDLFSHLSIRENGPMAAGIGKCFTSKPPRCIKPSS